MIFGYEKLQENGEPIENCLDFVSNNWNICDCHNYFCGMFQKVKHDFIQKTESGEFKVNTPLKFRSIKSIKDEKYFYVINIKEFAAAMGVDRVSGLELDNHVFEYMGETALNHCRENQSKIIINYGYEGFGSDANDSILSQTLLTKLHKILDEYNLPYENIIYLDGNTFIDSKNLNTKVRYFSYEYCALDWERYTSMHPSMTYHGNKRSIKNLKKFEKTKDIVRNKYFLSFNRLPKQHRFDFVLSLFKNRILDKGYVSFPKKNAFWKFETYYQDLKPYELKFFDVLPLTIDDIDLEEKKWSFELTSNNFYLDSYFQVVNENQFTSLDDQIQFSEKVWKPITNFQPFILLGDRFMLRQLRVWGFQTFEPFIDESYDNELDKDKRFDMVISQVKKLCEMPIEEIDEWYWSIEDKIKHNYYHFYNQFSRKQRDKLYKKLKETL